MYRYIRLYCIDIGYNSLLI